MPLYAPMEDILPSTLDPRVEEFAISTEMEILFRRKTLRLYSMEKNRSIQKLLSREAYYLRCCLRGNSASSQDSLIMECLNKEFANSRAWLLMSHSIIQCMHGEIRRYIKLNTRKVLQVFTLHFGELQESYTEFSSSDDKGISHL